MIRFQRLAVILLLPILSIAMLSATPSSASHHAGPIVAPVVKRAPVARTAAPAILSTPLKWRTSGPGVAYPDRTDPTRLLTGHEQRVFQCIRYYESRNHVRNDGTIQQGWYQFELGTWNLARPFIPGLAPTPNQASGDQQSQVAIWYYHHNGNSWVVEWRAEMGECY